MGLARGAWYCSTVLNKQEKTDKEIELFTNWAMRSDVIV